MAELKTRPTDADVTAFLEAVLDDARRADAHAACALLGQITGASPKLWGKNIVGFGSYDYTYASGRAGTWFEVGFAPRKTQLTLYVMSGFQGEDEVLGRLGKHKTGKSCLHVKRLSDVDMTVLRELVERSVATIRERHPG